MFRSCPLAVTAAVALVLNLGCEHRKSRQPSTPLPHYAELKWVRASSSVVGYNIYRGTQHLGPYELLNTSPQPGAVYVDHTVQAGQTYYYVVRAVDRKGRESRDSNEVCAVIPSP